MNRISIITICYNNKTELLKTIDSIDAQSLLPYEHWIIDGSTTSDINAYLNAHTQPLYRYWICERDKGISDAFNKGFKHCKGEIIQFLNSGDTLFSPSVLSSVTEVFSTHTSITWTHGLINIYRGGHWVVIGKPFEANKLYRGMRATFHPTMFVRKELFSTAGSFDLSLSIAMDYDFLIRIRDEPFFFMNSPISSMDPGGISNSSYLNALKEIRNVYFKYFGKSLKLELWQLRLKMLYYLISSPIGNLLYTVKKKLKLENV
jgi:glycosyltransferase involved in cell wall biosynthesis